MAASGYSLPNQARHQHQLVVVDPDDVAGPMLGDDGVGEATIDCFVQIEILDLQRQLTNQVVKQRPQDAVTEPLVVALDLARAELDGADVELAVSATESDASASVRLSPCPGQPIQSPPCFWWIPARPVASPPVLASTRRLPSTRLTEMGSRLETMMVRAGSTMGRPCPCKTRVIGLPEQYG